MKRTWGEAFIALQGNWKREDFCIYTKKMDVKKPNSIINDILQQLALQNTKHAKPFQNVCCTNSLS